MIGKEQIIELLYALSVTLWKWAPFMLLAMVPLAPHMQEAFA